MNVLFYLPETSNVPEWVNTIIGMATQRANVRIAQCIGTLVDMLRSSRADVGVVVLLAGTGEDIRELYSLNSLLVDIRTILILPDNQRETFSAGYKLYPRYLTTMDDGPRELAAVLEKMIETSKKERRAVNSPAYSEEEQAIRTRRAE